MFHEPAQFSWKVDRKHSIKAYRSWAEEAWARHSQESLEVQSPCDYEAGFKDGFVDFVNFGGNGEPPPVPPRKYWNLEYRTLVGESSAADWFAGFRHGARVAREEGYRRMATIDSSVFRLGPQDSHCFDNYYPEEIYDSTPQDAESMELLPPGEIAGEPEAEMSAQEEFPVEQSTGPDLPPNILPGSAESKAPASWEETPGAESGQAPVPRPEDPKPARKPTPQPDPSSELEDLFGNTESRQSSVGNALARKKGSAALRPALDKQVERIPREGFVR